jgi:hypothetical protein
MCATVSRRDLQVLSSDGTGGARQMNGHASRAPDAAQLAGIAADIEASAVAIEAQLNQIIHEEVERLRILLRSTVNKHAASERVVLIDTLSRGRAPRVWTHEGVELRRALAHVFGQGFQQAAARLMSFHARVAPELRRLMDMLAPDVEASGAKIEALIRAEFSPITEELLYVTEAAFQDFSTRTIKWSFGACRNLLHALERRPRQVQAEYADGRRSGDGAQVAQDRAASLDFQRQRLQYNEALTQNLEHLTRYVDTVLQFEAPRP